MHNIRTALKFLGLWLGPALLALAIYWCFFPIAPFGDAALLPALASAIISAIAWLFARGPANHRHRVLLTAVVLVAIGLWGFRSWDAQRDFTQQEVSFENRGATLVGTLYLPKGSDASHPVPGMVWVHGSGPETRALNKSYAEHFARAGYAILAFDKRGVGKSTGHYEFANAVDPANMDLLASDASAALSLMAKRSEVNAEKVGLVGVSQAGWIIPRAAVMNGHVAFMLLISGATTSTHTQMRYERFHLGEPSGALELSAVFKAFTRGDIPDGMTPDQADVEAQKHSVSLPYPDYDPAVDLRTLDIPGLWLLGDSDWMVPSGPTARIIDQLKQEGKPYQYRHIPGALHGMMLGPKALVLDAIDGWLAQVTAR